MISKVKKKVTIVMLLLIYLILPFQVFAYSDYIIAGGQNIGIELDSSGILIVGTYKIGDKDPSSEAQLQKGDKIIKINDTSVSTIEEMLGAIDSVSDKSKLDITYKRGSLTSTTTLNLVLDSENVYKTGLYVKDSINGVGTLTFIDPKTKIYGALGHEVIESTTGQKLEIKDGKIYRSTVTGITRSSEGEPGEKNARYDVSDVFGNIKENSSSGIFGVYTSELPNTKLYKVASKKDIMVGDAKVLTVISGSEVQEFDIKILKVSLEERAQKNILFEVTDDELLEKTGGIVQGMSGSPIIQNDMIVGAVTHVVVDDVKKGYGIFITNMLEEAEN